MEKTLNRIVTKLSRIPAAAWFFLLAASFFFADLYGLKTTVEQMIETLIEAVDQGGMDISGLNFNSFAWFSMILSAIITAGLYELVVGFAYRMMFQRGEIAPDPKMLRTAARTAVFAANIVVGLISILYFFSDSYQYLSPYLGFIVYTAAYILAFHSLIPTEINPLKMGTAFMRLFKVYFIVIGIFSVYNAFFGLLDADKTAGILYWVKVALVAGAAAAIYYWDAKKLLKRERAQIIAAIPPDDGPKPPDEVFRGYGF